METLEEQFVRGLTRVQPMMRRYVLAAVLDHAAMEEVVQETNLALWRKMAAYDDSRDFAPWAMQFAKMQVMAYRKRCGSGRVVPLDDRILDQLAEEAPGVLDGEEERLSRLEECLKRLGGHARRLLELRYTEGLTVRSISLDIGKSEGSLQQAFFKIRRQLRECIERSSKQSELA